MRRCRPQQRRIKLVLDCRILHVCVHRNGRRRQHPAQLAHARHARVQRGVGRPGLHAGEAALVAEGEGKLDDEPGVLGLRIIRAPEVPERSLQCSGASRAAVVDPQGEAIDRGPGAHALVIIMMAMLIVLMMIDRRMVISCGMNA